MDALTISASVDISASPAQVWRALTEPDLIRQYFFGTDVASTWEPGSPITWSGEYDGHSYRDHGEVVACVREQMLVVTHFSPMSGQEDVPENYHTLTYRLEDRGEHTHLAFEQDNTPPGSAEEFTANWTSMLEKLKELLERG